MFRSQWCFNAALIRNRVCPLAVFKQWNADMDVDECFISGEWFVISSIALTTSPFNPILFEIVPWYLETSSIQILTLSFSESNIPSLVKHVIFFYLPEFCFLEIWRSKSMSSNLFLLSSWIAPCRNAPSSVLQKFINIGLESTIHKFGGLSVL